MAKQTWEYRWVTFSRGAGEGAIVELWWDEKDKKVKRKEPPNPITSDLPETERPIAMMGILGQDGWDFVSTWEVPGKGLANEPVVNRYYLFKRPKQ